ncbi:MAG: CocE/NonD family hydrolase [Pseudomonadota bacterium]
MEFELRQTVWITLEDGTKLAATIWMPDGPGPFPAVLEYLPYRRGDGTAPRDDATYPAYAKAGIVGVRVDSRGQGDSEGLFDDEYSPQELSDASEVIAWIADQDWSNGAVGMMGISWGGFNGLQVSALRPPALKAVISIASTSDRYNDDIHYKNGCLLSANIYWAGTMLSYSSRPPDPEVVGNRWAEIWRERLEAEPMLLEVWMRHQHRDAYWRHGSICEDWGAIQCPVWVIAGWADGYRNTPAALAANLRAPVKATTGPWVHKYPHFAWPHPRIDFLGQSIDWWHHWLSDEPRGIEDWPDYSAYRIEAGTPSAWRARDQGAWIGVDWPQDQKTNDLGLGDSGVLGSTGTAPVEFATPQHCGTMAGEYFTLAPNADMPGDQRTDDALSQCWQMPIDQPLDLLGRAEVQAEISIDQTQGNLIARLVDVHPDGTANLIARGVLNLCHRESYANPRPMMPETPTRISIALDECCYRVRSGHRLRLALSTAYWPLVIPSPAPVTATVHPGAVLRLPLAPEGAEVELPEPTDPSPLPDYPQMSEPAHRRWVEHDLNAGRVRYHIVEDSGLSEVPRSRMQTHETRHEIWEIDPKDPTSITGQLAFSTERSRDAWQARTESTIDFAATATDFSVKASVVAWQGETEFHRKDWTFSIHRNLV